MALKFNIFTGNFDIINDPDSVSTSTSLGSLWSLAIKTTVQKQTWVVGSSGSLQVSSETPFGTTAPINGAEITLVGSSDTNFVRVDAYDGAKGVLGGDIDIFRGESVTFKYISSLDRYVIVGKSN